jgi:hypothetical protein
MSDVSLNIATVKWFNKNEGLGVLVFGNKELSFFQADFRGLGINQNSELAWTWPTVSSVDLGKGDLVVAEIQALSVVAWMPMNIMVKLYKHRIVEEIDYGLGKEKVFLNLCITSNLNDSIAEMIMNNGQKHCDDGIKTEVWSETFNPHTGEWKKNK